MIEFIYIFYLRTPPKIYLFYIEQLNTNLLYDSGTCTTKIAKFNFVLILLDITFKHNLKKLSKGFVFFYSVSGVQELL